MADQEVLQRLGQHRPVPLVQRMQAPSGLGRYVGTGESLSKIRNAHKEYELNRKPAMRFFDPVKVSSSGRGKEDPISQPAGCRFQLMYIRKHPCRWCQGSPDANTAF